MKMVLKESLGFTVVSLLMPCFLLCLQAGCAKKPSPGTALQRLQGSWEGVALGQETPGGPFVKSAGTITIKIAGNSFHYYRDTNFWFETTITLPAGTNPQQLRATIEHSAPPEGSNGKVVVAIFKVEDETLTLAARGDGSEETPISFEDAKVTRYELRKVQPQNTNTELLKSK